MKSHPWTVFLVMFAALLIVYAAQGGQVETVKVDSIRDSELPQSIQTTETVRVRLVGESGSAGMVGLPEGTTVEVTGRDGHMLQIVFGKSTGQINISNTTALAEVTKKREEQEQARSAHAALFAAQARRSMQELKIERGQRRDIIVLSWTWRPSAGGEFYEAVGEIENESDRALENVQVEVTISDANDKIVSTDTAMVSDQNLSPGQRTTFKAMIRRVGGEQKASLSFRKFWGERYTHREK